MTPTEIATELHELDSRITQYLSVGGLFNPEHMEHDKVRLLIMDVHKSLLAAADIVAKQPDLYTLADCLASALVGDFNAEAALEAYLSGLAHDFDKQNMQAKMECKRKREDDLRAKLAACEDEKFRLAGCAADYLEERNTIAAENARMWDTLHAVRERVHGPTYHLGDDLLRILSPVKPEMDRETQNLLAGCARVEKLVNAGGYTKWQDGAWWIFWESNGEVAAGPAKSLYDLALILSNAAGQKSPAGGNPPQES